MARRMWANELSRATRSYHLSISPQAIADDPDLLDLAHQAGITDVWSPASCTATGTIRWT